VPDEKDDPEGVGHGRGGREGLEVLADLSEESGGEALAAVEGDVGGEEAGDGPAEEGDAENAGVEVEGGALGDLKAVLGLEGESASAGSGTEGGLLQSHRAGSERGGGGEGRSRRSSDEDQEL